MLQSKEKGDLMMKYRLTGISTPLGGLSWEYTKTSKKNAQELVDILCGHRVLFNSCQLGCDRCTEFTSKSVLKMKEILTQKLTEISEDDELKSCVRQMRQACNDFLNEKICVKLLINIPHSINKEFCPIIKLRKDITYYLKIIVNMYGFKENMDLILIFTSNKLL